MRLVAQSRPPCSSSQSIWSANRNRVATAGVLSVWSLVELSSAVAMDRNSGIQRPDSAISAIRARARGEAMRNP